MGKNLTQQKAGRGTTTYRAPSHNFTADTQLPRINNPFSGFVVDLVHCSGHTCPLAKITSNDRSSVIYVPAVEGLAVGEKIEYSEFAPIKLGNILPLKNIPEGTIICNVELTPGDGGKFVRSSGGHGKVIAKQDNQVQVMLPSKKTADLNGNCRAIIGVVSGGGRTEKPFMKAGKKFHAMKARNRYWPKVSGTSMNAVDHPFGNSRSSRKGRPTIAPKNAPPGQKVGMIRPRHTGRNK